MNWKDYLEILLRRRWYAIIPLAISVAVSVVLCFTLPKAYRSTTSILVEQQKVPEAYVKSSVSASIEQRVSTIQQQIMSHSLLTKVIEEFGLYRSDPPKTADRLVSVLQKQIKVQVVKKGRNIEAFSISFEGDDPTTTMKVTNKLASLFIEENLKAREEFVEGTSAFLDSELNAVKAELEAQESKLRQFRQQYMGGLPEQTAANLRTLDRLQMEHQAVWDALAKAKERRAGLFEKDPNLRPIPVGRGAADGLRKISPTELHLIQLHSELADLQTRFTDKYPDVIRVKKGIADLEEQLKTGSATKEPSRAEPTKKEEPAELTLSDPALDGSLQGQLAQSDLEILNLEKRHDQINKQIKSYEDRVENAPLRDQQMLGLMRDYENTKKHYQSLLDKKLNAQISENLEKRQKGEQFRILDPATPPTKPFKPDWMRIILFGIVAGLGTGGGAVYLRETMDVTFRKSEEVEAILRLPVLACIPNIGQSLKWEKKSA